MSDLCSEVENMIISKEYFFFIRDLYSDYAKYIKQYKSISIDYMRKLEQLQDKYSSQLNELNKNNKKKYNNINTKIIFSLTSTVPYIVKNLIDNMRLFVSGIENTTEKIENTIKEKTNIALKYQTKCDESKNNLLKHYKNIDKLKDLYMNSMSNCEDFIYKYYNNNNKTYQKKNNNEEKNKKEIKEKFKNAFDTKILTKDQKNTLISNSKKLEKQYKNSFESINIYEKEFNDSIEESTQQMKAVSYDLTIKLKDIILDFIVLLKNSFKMPLSEIDTLLPEVTNLDNSKYQNIINESYKSKKSLINAKPKKYKIKCCNEPETINGKYNPNNHIVKTEDGFEELSFIDDTPTFLTIKEMSENFELIDNDNIDLKLEEEKIKCKELTLKLLSFDTKPITENNILLSEEEINELDNLLDKHHNRVLFLQSLSTFRARGIFDLPIDIYDLIYKLFCTITKTIIRDKDFHCAKNVIILSQTYYYLDNKKRKVYLQERIKNEKVFTSSKFWKAYLENSIENEIVKRVTSDAMSGNLIKENQKESDDMYSNMVFAQLVPISDNMIEFGINRKEIREIIKPIIKHYNMNEQSISIIDDVIHKYSERKSIKLNEEIKQLDLKLLYKNRKNFDSSTKLNELSLSLSKNESENNDSNNNIKDEIYEDIDDENKNDYTLDDKVCRDSEYFLNRNEINEENDENNNIETNLKIGK